ncbi:LuxR C-terminal-related transcriptional regulator [Glutamicibacter sp. MNS18]|uniref:helix-turn-helix transcriptional regulator n=1 Tax=Glutamicibacter sp. MNS18 TaxID=2989817 RepID=UPI002235C9E0|nr:LuxR family transcriptional regulator [Glutamicibacter sp. MNS18]MCW4464189.1 LuxR C-terminal-related transcriptional regulator [Glutamicibacter sp. MNS18]
MSGPLPGAEARLIQDLLEQGAGRHRWGWVIHDGFLDSLDLWTGQLRQHPGLHLLGRIRATGMPGTEGADLQPLAAQLGGALAAESVQGPAAGLFGALEHFRRLLESRPGTPVLVIQQPADLDGFSQRVLGALAQEGRLRLALHLVPGGTLPVRWLRWDEAGYLVHCPVLRLPAARIPELFRVTGPIPVPELCAIGLHHATGGEQRVLDALLQHTDPEQLRSRLTTGRIGGLTGSGQLSNLLRLRRVRLLPELRELLDLCALAGHLPVAVARRLSGRAVLDQLTAGGLLRREWCSGTMVVALNGTLLGEYWTALLSPYDQVRLAERLEAETPCCQVGSINRRLVQLGRLESPDTGELCQALDLACDRGEFAAAERLARALREQLGSLRSQQGYQQALTALARHAALLQGPYQALRVLNSRTGPHRYDWSDPAGTALVVQQCLETGRLLPTAQRLAVLGSLPVPAEHGDPAFWALLPADELHGHMRRGLAAALNANLRGAVVHFIAGLRKCGLHPQSSNARTLRVSFLANAAICLALGGYHRQWNTLLARLREQPAPWHAHAAPAWHAAQGMIQLQDGDLEDGRRMLAEAAALARDVDQNNVSDGAHAFEVWLGAQQLNDEPSTARTPLPLSELLGLGRGALEEELSQALMREPEALARALELAHGLQDPRGRAISLATRAELGLLDPLEAVGTLREMGQDFLAAWLVDGILLRRMLVHVVDMPIPQSRRIEELMAFTGELIRRCESVQLPPLPAPLVQVLRTAPEQSLPVLPFAAHEAKRRKLTQREAQILGLVRCGRGNRDIARELTVSIRTVEGHIAAILDKYALGSRALLAAEDIGAHEHRHYVIGNQRQVVTA